MRRLIIIFASILLLMQAKVLFAYQIVAIDKASYVFKSGEIKKDPNRYQVIYEVDEVNKTLSVVKEVDLRTGQEYPATAIYQIVAQPTMEQFKLGNALKATRFNPTIATVETISFCNGEYHYSKTTEKWINLFYGSYKIDF